MGINDPLLSGLLSQYNQLTVEKSKMSDVLISPRLTQLNDQLGNVKEAMLENINNIVDHNHQMLADLQRRTAMVEARVGKLPVTERDLFKIERRYNMNN